MDIHGKYRDLWIYTMDIRGIYRDLYIYIPCTGSRETTKKHTECSMVFRFMLDGKKVHKSTLVCLFGILMG